MAATEPALTNALPPNRRRLASLRQVLAYRHDDAVRRLAHDHGMSIKDAAGVMEDALRSLYLYAARRERFAPPPRIDRAWHVLLLFTRDYAAVRERHLGGFIHHQPHAHGVAADPGPAPRTLAAARRLFRRLGPNWSFGANGTASSSDCGFSDCTRCGGSTNCHS